MIGASLKDMPGAALVGFDENGWPDPGNYVFEHMSNILLGQLNGHNWVKSKIDSKHIRNPGCYLLYTTMSLDCPNPDCSFQHSLIAFEQLYYLRSDHDGELQIEEGVKMPHSIPSLTTWPPKNRD